MKPSPKIASNGALAKNVAELLSDLKEKVVFAESCTAGMVSATLSQIPGISNYLCGSLVTYRPKSKRLWLGVSKKTINDCTTESQEVATEMAIGALERCPEAKWSVSVVGHFGPDAPEEKDGQVFVCVARRTNKKKLKVKDTLEQKLTPSDRVSRQREATELALTALGRSLMSRSRRKEHKK